MRNKYLVVHDYQSGGAAFLIFADRVEQVIEYFPPPYNEVISEDIENHHIVRLLRDKILSYGIDDLPLELRSEN